MSVAAKIIGIVCGLTAVTVAALICDARISAGVVRDHARQFQDLAGGLGIGATVRPRWCFINFDPRLERCTCTEFPLPGGYCYCPEHTGTVSFFTSNPKGSAQQ
jgi:hypothetical protein